MLLWYKKYWFLIHKLHVFDQKHKIFSKYSKLIKLEIVTFSYIPNNYIDTH